MAARKGPDAGEGKTRSTAARKGPDAGGNAARNTAGEEKSAEPPKDKGKGKAKPVDAVQQEPVRQRVVKRLLARDSDGYPESYLITEKLDDGSEMPMVRLQNPFIFLKVLNSIRFLASIAG